MIEADPRHRQILLAQMNLDGAKAKSVTTPAVKIQEWTLQMLTKIDRDRMSTFRSATMRASYMSINRVDVQQAVKEVARFMEESNEVAWIMLKRLVGSITGGRLAQVISEQVRQGTTRGHRQRQRRFFFFFAYQEEHDVCSSLPWRQLDEGRELDARYAKFECCCVIVLRRSQRRVHFNGCEKA